MCSCLFCVNESFIAAKQTDQTSAFTQILTRADDCSSTIIPEVTFPLFTLKVPTKASLIFKGYRQNGAQTQHKTYH